MADSQDIFKAAVDPYLNQRTSAIAVQEAYNNASVSGGWFSVEVKKDPFGTPIRQFQWVVAIQVQDAYASGMASDASDPPDPEAGSKNVLDADILAAVQANWPA